MKNIKFIKTPSLYNPHGCIVAHISNINSKEELLKELNIKLKFPYFGFNWDALYDLLRDFHWIDQKGIILVHECSD
jgi:RNAse (barnase) inhibitor barstar